MFKSIWTDIVARFNYGDTVLQLVIINVMVWAGVIVFGLFAAPFVGIGSDNPIVDWLAVPGDAMALLTRPWTILTYMFTHEGFMHILFNMLILYWFGEILANYLGKNRIIPVYVLGGLVGFLFYFGSSVLLPANFSDFIGTPMLGASAGVMAIVMAAASIAPTHTMHLFIIGPVQIRYIALVLILLDLFGIQKGSNTGGHLAHLGGVALGFLFIEQLKTGKDWSIPFNRLLESAKGLFERRERSQSRKQSSSAAASTASGRTRTKRKSPGRTSGPMTAEERQARVDAILDKIRESGYENVTAEEMAFLNQMSEDRANNKD